MPIPPAHATLRHRAMAKRAIDAPRRRRVCTLLRTPEPVVVARSISCHTSYRAPYVLFVCLWSTRAAHVAQILFVIERTFGAHETLPAHQQPR